MKHLTIVFLLLVGLMSCKKIDKHTQFNIEYTSKATIPSSSGTNTPLSIPTPNITTNIEQELSEHDSRKDKIEYANLKELRLDITSPSNANFDFLNDIDIYIKADGLSKQKIAEKHNIAENQSTTLNLDVVPEIDLQNYIKADKFYLDITVVTDKVNLFDVKLDVYSKIFIDAKVLGV
jgi:hypothetical protein